MILLAVPAVLLTRNSLSRLRQVQLATASVTAVVVGLAVLLVHALRQLPLDRLSPASQGVLGLCGATLIAVYVVLVREWHRTDLTPG
jgi:drug/metabolite transporter (DMT)-like permease